MLRPSPTPACGTIARLRERFEDETKLGPPEFRSPCRGTSKAQTGIAVRRLVERNHGVTLPSGVNFDRICRSG